MSRKAGLTLLSSPSLKMIRNSIQITGANLQPIRTLTSMTHLSPRVSFMSNGNTTGLLSNRPSLTKYRSEGRPLTIILPWFMAKKKAVEKYAKVYLDKGFDVLTIGMSGAHLFLPSLYEPIITREILATLLSSDHDEKIVHSFSAGGFVFTRIQKHAELSPHGEKFLGTIKSQIYDSMADISSLKIGSSKTIFVTSPLLQKVFSNYVDLHLKVFSGSTKILLESIDIFYNKPVTHAPALFLSSELDPISPPSMHRGMIDCWRGQGITCEHKVWNDTPHVGHMKVYPEEYKELVWKHLKRSGINVAEKDVIRRREEIVMNDGENITRRGDNNRVPNIVQYKTL
ncbi:transmembrane protein 53-A-like [Folsomia candida]|uniref:Transmembrane protein 53-B n=1 Tax=Folsomia candida TaxID=158441 RepID=A0A226DR28_FOLCA|nr:transmembrane protein 53-A-like [Folsomia candida]OXA47520.1 Transmembrane protein 53-B [Folsomia candida]